MIGKRGTGTSPALTGGDTIAIDSAARNADVAAGSRLGLVCGLLLFALEAIQGLVLPFLIREALGTAIAAGWVVLMSSAGLVGLACSAQGPSVVRSISRLQTAGSNATAGLPANWSRIGSVLRVRQGAVLIVAQLTFLLFGHNLFVDLGPEALGVIGLVFLAQHLRLLAFTNFAGINGLRRVGLDKAQQAAASAATLLLSLAVVWLAPSMLAIALVPVLTHAALYLASAVVLRRALVLGQPVEIAGFVETGSLLFLAVAGYLSTNSDVLLGSLLLPAQQQFQFGVLARALLVLLAISGLWAHLRFPHWCSAELTLNAGLREVALLGARLAVFVTLFAVLGLAFVRRCGLPLALELPVWMVAAMLINALLSSMTAAIGQVLLAKHFLNFVWPTIVLALVAPLLAIFSARLLGPHAFVLGYGVSSLLVLLTLWLCIRDLQPEVSSQLP